MQVVLESASRLGPCLLAEATGELLNVLTELPATATALTARLDPKKVSNRADPVQVMNCYYPNTQGSLVLNSVVFGEVMGRNVRNATDCRG